MKHLILLVIAIYAVQATPSHLLGSKQCTWGPSYWCSNLTAASGCHAVPHCIQTVWQHQTVQQDKDSVCQICLDMVKQARDQLLSNETEEEIKEVFEGSCKLIPVKLIKKECCALVDDFIPELVDTLASQMNPQVVCSVAGLCNNARYDKLIEDYESSLKRSVKKIDPCDGCHTVVDIMERKFDKMSKDEVLQAFLRICGHMGSLSDGCSNIVVTYFQEIYEHLENNLNPTDVCLLAGECSAQFHRHVEITTTSNVGVVKFGEKDDLPCELCQQLVTHLRDLLVANTTEEEFKRVLVGLCKQTGQFTDECLNLVDEYYPIIYQTLVENLNGTAACALIGICPTNLDDYEDVPIRPLLPVQSANKAIALAGKKVGKVNLEKPEMMQLPIERVFPPFGAPNEVYNQQACVFCEYLLHYLQEAITEPSSESEIKRIVSKVCDKLPASINATCLAFVDTYGDAICSLLAQEFDPSIICPLIRVCPAPQDVKDVETFKEIVGGDQPKCPMCLFAVTKLEEMIKNDKTEESIENALNKLCSHFNGKIKLECQDFVTTYSRTLVNLLIDDLKPQNICVALKLCNEKAPDKPITPVHVEDVEILTNEIPDHTKNGVSYAESKQVENKPQCVICEFAMSKLQNLLQNKTTEQEIEDAVLKLCDDLPKSVRGECKKFVNTYADLVIQLLIGTLKPDEICEYIGLCDKNGRNAQVQPIEPKPEVQNLKSPQCVLCKLLMTQIEKYIIGPITKEGVEDGLRQICNTLPRSEKKSCYDFVKKYGDIIATLLIQATNPAEVCSLTFLCAENEKILTEIRTCATCEALYINVVNGMLNGMEKVEDACELLEDPYKPECLQIANKHAVTLVRSAFYQTDVTSVCHGLEYCKGPSNLGRIQREIQL
ncbi:prosaposin [Onthophagus taurus]|uniref:prosaposin n=1 Tax=Onthophagus taurus TaxID=166361 RepID=UPI0039BE41F3